MRTGQTDRAEDLAREPDRGDRPSPFGIASDMEVKDAIQADHHREASENRRVIRGGGRRTGIPIGDQRRPDAPGDVVEPGRDEDCAMKSTARRSFQSGLNPVIIGLGAAWATAATRGTAISRRSPLLAWTLVLILAIVPLATLSTLWRMAQ